MSAFYFFYFSTLGALLPYWGLFLKDEGFDPLAIAALSAILMVTKVVAPSVWGWLGDRFGRRLAIIRWGSFMALLSFIGVFFSRDFVVLALVITCYSFFWNAVLPQFEVVTLCWLREKFRFYSLVRLWGSVGFILAVVLLGYWFDYHPLQSLPLIISLLLLGIWLSSLSLSPPSPLPGAELSGSLWQVLRRPGVIGFFAVNLLLQFSHGPYYTFYSIYLEAQGVSRTSIGALWSLGVMAEVALFACMHQVLHRWSLRAILLTSLWLAALRWYLIAVFPQSFAVLLFAQLLHAASFGSSHAVAIEFVRRFFPLGHQGQGQALYSGLCFGLGGALGALGAGLLWDHDPALSFEVAAASCVLAAVLASLWVRGELLLVRGRDYAL